MKLATVLTPPTPRNLRRAAQCGVTDLVTRYPGSDLDQLAREQQNAREFGLTLSVVEGFLPIERIKIGTDDGHDLQAMKELLQKMGELQIPILCYNFMAGTDWVRTELAAEERGGSLVTGFSLSDAEKAILLGHDSTTTLNAPELSGITADQLWANLGAFLKELIPVAEACGVYLTMHPDDPPLPEFQKRPRIMNSVESFQRLLSLVPSTHNAICFCQGTFATMGVDIPQAIRQLGSHIRYVHFRDVRGTADLFHETWHDNGPTDMVAAMQAYHDIGFSGPIRPDHVPQLDGEQDGEPGYTMAGRLFAWGYMRGLMQAAESA